MDKALMLPGFRTGYQATVIMQCGISKDTDKEISGKEQSSEIEPQEHKRTKAI